MTAQTTVRTLGSSTMLMSLNIKQWSGNKLDRSETEGVRRKTGAKAGAVRVHKSLLPDATELAELTSFVGQVREFFNARTAAWAGDMRIIRSDCYLEFAKALGDYKRQFGELADKVRDSYSLRVTEAQGSLGTAFDASDYPSAEEVRSRFTFHIRVAPTPSVKDWRLDLSDTIMGELKDELEAQTTSAIGGALADVTQRIAEVARKAHERLKDPNAVFRDSLIGNIDELVALLPALNVTGDPKLDDLATDLRLSVFGVTPEVLRADPLSRSQKATEFDKIAANAEALADMFGAA